MEILYLWIESYRNLNEQGFNFSTEFIFNLEKTVDGDKSEYLLTIIKNDRYIPNFFDNPFITNATAVIGQNGTGKSNLLDFIKKYLPINNHEWPSGGIIAYRIDNQLYLLFPDSMNLKISDNTSSFNRFPYPYRLPREAEGVHKTYADAHYIYYSNIVDLRREEIYLGGFTNISTLACILSDNEYDALGLSNKLTDSFSKYKANEIRRNVQFLLSKDRSLLKFQLPEFLYIDWLTNEKKILSDKYPDIQTVLGLFSQETDSKVPVQGVESILDQIYIAVWLNFLYTFLERSSYRISLPITVPGPSQNIRNYISQFFLSAGAMEITDPAIGAVEVHVRTFQEMAVLVPQFLDHFESKLRDGTIILDDNPFLGGKSLKFSITENTQKDLEKLLTLYIQVKGIPDFLDFSWRSLSSGQQSFFTLLSRFYHLKVSEQNPSQSLVILIDEGDIYFHPEWQKKFFDMTLTFLAGLFPQKYIQLIFTSNTPFIASDLPKDNIIFIEKVGDMNHSQIMVHGPENSRSETFAGNIHTMLSDSFYMRGALIGDFAKKRIDKILAYLIDPLQTERNYGYLKTIDIVGEPILKLKLQQMWDQKFGDQEEIRNLEKRIEFLKRRNYDKNR
jgi:hypothetical protein